MDGVVLKSAKLWTFDGSTDGFTAVGSRLAPAAGQGLSIRIADPTLRSPKALDVPGARFPLVLVRLTRVAPGAAWDGALYYTTAAHGEAPAYLGKPVSGDDPKVNETTTLVYDMRRQANGGPDWTASIIDQIRLDIEDRPGGGFVIQQVAIAAAPAAPRPRRSPDSEARRSRGVVFCSVIFIFYFLPVLLIGYSLSGWRAGAAADRQRRLLCLGRGRLCLPAPGPHRPELRRPSRWLRRRRRPGVGAWRC